jgi:hypothetical protein
MKFFALIRQNQKMKITQISPWHFQIKKFFRLSKILIKISGNWNKKFDTVFIALVFFVVIIHYTNKSYKPKGIFPLQKFPRSIEIEITANSIKAKTSFHFVIGRMSEEILFNRCQSM